MIPVTFPQSNESIVFSNDLDVPIYESGVETISCWKLNKEEIDLIYRTGKLWVRLPADRPMPQVKLTVYNPFKKLQPLTVGEHVSDRIIIHLEDDEEIILFKLEKGCILNVATDFVDKVKLIGWAAELPEYARVIELYKLDPKQVYILKRARQE